MQRPDISPDSYPPGLPEPLCGTCGYFRPRQGYWQRLLLSAGRGDCAIHERPTRSEHSCSCHAPRHASGGE